MNPIESEHHPLPGQRVPLAATGLTLRYEHPQDLSDEALTGILELLRRAFNGGPSWFALGATPLDHLEWKAARPGESLIQLTEDGDRIVGFSLNAQSGFLVNGSEASVRQGFDSALDPEFQGRGINAARRNSPDEPRLAAKTCLSMSTGMHPTSLMLRGPGAGIPFGNAIETLIKPLSIRRMIAARGRRHGDGAGGESHTRDVLEVQKHRLPTPLKPDRVLAAARLAWSVLRPAKRLPGHAPWRIRTVDHFDESADEFWSEAGRAFDFIQVRDRAYLNWRYCDPRGGPFTVRVAELDGALLGYAALRADEHGAVLGDLLVLPDRDDVARALIADAITLAKERRAPFLRCWMPRSHPYRRLLGGSGFIQYRTPLTFNYRPLECDPADLEFLQDPGARIHLMTADSDHL